MTSDYKLDPADYVGTHRYTAVSVMDVCRCHPDCNARVFSHQNPAGDVHGDEYQPRHAAVSR
jgi:hypothetical protein